MEKICGAPTSPAPPSPLVFSGSVLPSCGQCSSKIEREEGRRGSHHQRHPFFEEQVPLFSFSPSYSPSPSSSLFLSLLPSTEPTTFVSICHSSFHFLLLVSSAVPPHLSVFHVFRAAAAFRSPVPPVGRQPQFLTCARLSSGDLRRNTKRRTKRFDEPDHFASPPVLGPLTYGLFLPFTQARDTTINRED